MGLVNEMGSFITTTSYEDLPDALLDRLADDTVDIIACMLVGATTPWGAATIDRLSERDEPSISGVIGTHVSGLPDNAAFAMATLGHALDLDDYHPPSKHHPATVVFPTAFAVGQQRGSSGRDVLVATAVGFEVMIRASLALGAVQTMLAGFHLTGICGALGAAATAARLRGLDAATTAHALGLAATQSSGLMGFLHDGSESKRIHPGRAAHAGITAVELAERGLTGPPRALELEHGGFLHAFSPDPDVEVLCTGLGSTWHATRVSFKRHACCGSIHASLDATLEAVAQIGPHDVGSITRVQVWQSQAVISQCGWPYEPSDALHAQMSLRYCLAALLLDNQISPAQFRDELLGDPQILDLIDRIEVHHDPRLDEVYPTAFTSRIEISTTDRTFGSEVDHPRGAPDNPMSSAEVDDKLRRLGADRLPDQQLEQLITVARSVSELPDISALIEAGRP